MRIITVCHREELCPKERKQHGDILGELLAFVAVEVVYPVWSGKVITAAALPSAAEAYFSLASDSGSL